MFARSSLYALGLAVGLSALVPGQADAHRRWLLPSATVLAGEAGTVSVDAAASNELFGFDHRAMPLDSLVVTGPDGEAVEPDIIGSGAYRSVFDLPLKQQGTYRVALVSEGASDIRLSRNNTRTETFVTLGAPSEIAIQPTNRGLEMVAISHPNDIVAGEPAEMRFLIDGQPASGVEVEFVKGGTRYRDQAAIQMLTTDADGRMTLQAAEPGMYYLEASTTQTGVNGQPDRRSLYTAVLEFLPL